MVTHNHCYYLVITHTKLVRAISMLILTAHLHYTPNASSIQILFLHGLTRIKYYCLMHFRLPKMTLSISYNGNSSALPQYKFHQETGSKIPIDIGWIVNNRNSARRLWGANIPTRHQAANGMVFTRG